MPFITITSGGESLDGWGVVKFHAFLAKSPAFNAEPMFLWQAAKNSAYVRLIRKGPYTVAFRHIPNTPNLNPGGWTESTYDIPEGSILRLYATRPLNRVQRSASTFLKVRGGAAYRTITMPTTGHPQCNVREVSIQGNFDLLPFAEAIDQGVKIDRLQAAFFLPSSLEQLCTMTVNERARSLEPVVVREEIVNTEGEKVTFNIKEPPRKMLLS